MDMTVILDDLAAGRIDAAEAKRRIDALGLDGGTPRNNPRPEMSTEWPLSDHDKSSGPEPEEEPPWFAEEPPARADRVNGVSKVVIKATGRKVRLVADPLVSTAAAEDVHQIKRRGSVMEIQGDKEFSGVVDAISWARSIRGLDDVKALGFGQELVVRLNPALAVDLELTGCSLTAIDVAHIGKVRLTAGVATMTGVRGVSDLLLQAGQATITGRFNEGWSRFRCESGQVVVEVLRDSDAVIRADAQLGRISWEGCPGDDGQVTLGKGTAHVDLGVVVGHGVVRVL